MRGGGENIKRPEKLTSMIQALAKSSITKKYDLSSVIDLGSGAAPLGGDVIHEAEALWPEGDRKLKVCLSSPYLALPSPSSSISRALYPDIDVPFSFLTKTKTNSKAGA